MRYTRKSQLHVSSTKRHLCNAARHTFRYTARSEHANLLQHTLDIFCIKMAPGKHHNQRSSLISEYFKKSSNERSTSQYYAQVLNVTKSVNASSSEACATLGPSASSICSNGDCKEVGPIKVMSNIYEN